MIMRAALHDGSIGGEQGGVALKEQRSAPLERWRAVLRACTATKQERVNGSSVATPAGLSELCSTAGCAVIKERKGCLERRVKIDEEPWNAKGQ